MNLIKGDFFNPNTLTLIRLFETSFFRQESGQVESILPPFIFQEELI